MIGGTPIRRALPGGATLLALPRPEPAIACVRAYVPAGIRREAAEHAGVAMLTGRTLSEGTARWDGDEVARRIEAVGGDLVTTAVGGSVEVAACDLALGVETLLACIGSPTFPAERVERARERQRAALLAARDDPAEVARQAFDAAIYGEHPFARPAHGTLATLDALDAERCRQFHARHFNREKLVVSASGAIDVDAVAAMVSEAIEGWPEHPRIEPPAPPTPPAPCASEQTIALDGDKSQAHVYLGQLGIRRTDPDFYALLLMDHVLGLGAGFTDRLSSGLRDRDGLAYQVYASITSSAHLEPGTFHAYIGTSPELARRAVDGMRAEIARIRDEPVDAAELADARAYLAGSAVFGFQTARDLARYLLDRERFGFGDLHEQLPAILDAVSIDDVQAAARRHLDPDALTLVVATPSV